MVLCQFVHDGSRQWPKWHGLQIQRLLPEPGERGEAIKLLRQLLCRLADGVQVRQNLGWRVAQVFFEDFAERMDVAQRRTQVMRHRVHKVLKLGAHLGQLTRKPLNLR